MAATTQDKLIWRQAALDQPGGERVAQIVGTQVFDHSPHARGGKTLLDGFRWLAVAVGEEPGAGLLNG